MERKRRLPLAIDIRIWKRQNVNDIGRQGHEVKMFPVCDK